MQWRHLARAASRSSSTSGGAAMVWDTKNGPHRLNGLQTGWASISINADGKYAATGLFDGTAAVWDMNAGKKFRRLVGHTAAAKAIAFSPMGSWSSRVRTTKPQFSGTCAAGRELLRCVARSPSRSLRSVRTGPRLRPDRSTERSFFGVGKLANESARLECAAWRYGR